MEVTDEFSDLLRCIEPVQNVFLANGFPALSRDGFRHPRFEKSWEYRIHPDVVAAVSSRQIFRQTEKSCLRSGIGDLPDRRVKCGIAGYENNMTGFFPDHLR